MLKLTKEMLATEEMFNLLGEIIKDEYMPNTFEEFIQGFEESRFSRHEAPYDITEVPFAYAKEGEDGAQSLYLTLLFLPYGIAWFRGSSRDKLKDTRLAARDYFSMKYQKLLGDKCTDAEYFDYLERKNKHCLDLFLQSTKENKPKFKLFDFEAKKAYKNEVKKEYNELKVVHEKHLDYIKSKKEELSK